MSSQQNTVLDLSKPIRRKINKEQVQYVLKLKGKNDYPLLCLAIRNGSEIPQMFCEKELENIPQSRWLNVYVGNPIDADWYSSREKCDKYADHINGRVAVIEDKQDGTPWIVHQLEK